MTNIVQLAFHACASRRSFAAKSVKKSAVSPAFVAVGADNTDLHHSGGIRSRCHHFKTIPCVTPDTSVAHSMREGQRSITERNEAGCLREDIPMRGILGPPVLDCKSKLSHDAGIHFVDSPGMTDRMSETEERAAFINRVRSARLARFQTQKPICTILEVSQGTYKQYETRTPLPHRFIPKFAAATGVSLEWLLTGEGEGPRVEQFIRHVPKRTGGSVKSKKITQSRVA